MSLILSVIVLKTLLIAIILNIKDINNCNIEERHKRRSYYMFTMVIYYLYIFNLIIFYIV